MVVEMPQRQRTENRAGRFALSLDAGRQTGMAVAGLREIGGAEQCFSPANDTVSPKKSCV